MYLLTISAMIASITHAPTAPAAIPPAVTRGMLTMPMPMPFRTRAIRASCSGVPTRSTA